MTETKRFDPSKPYRRRDGIPAKIIYELPRQWVVVSEGTVNEEWVYFVRKPDGCSLYGDNGSGYDLVNIPEKHEVTIYFRMDVDGRIYPGRFPFEDQIAKKIITFEEGEGLEEAK